MTVTARAGQRSSIDRDPAAAPSSNAKARVAASAPATRMSELTMPALNSDKAGAVLSIGSESSMPVRASTQRSNAETLPAKLVGSSAVLSAGSTQAGLALPLSVLQSGRFQTARCRSRKPVPMRFSLAMSRNTPSRWKIWLIRSSARGQAIAAGPRDRHAPRDLGEAELLVETRREVGFGEVVGEEAVVLGGERAGLVAQAVGQHARLVEQHQARVLRDDLGVRAVADGDADGAAGDVRASPSSPARAAPRSPFRTGSSAGG